MSSALPNRLHDDRPWGWFEQFTHNECSTVKVLHIDPGEELSLQYHHHRSEFWYVVAGTGTITIGEESVEAAKGAEFFIPTGTQHRAAGADPDGITIVEIALGDFDEGDIVRTQDKYGRT